MPNCCGEAGCLCVFLQLVSTFYITFRASEMFSCLDVEVDAPALMQVSESQVYTCTVTYLFIYLFIYQCTEPIFVIKIYIGIGNVFARKQK